MATMAITVPRVAKAPTAAAYGSTLKLIATACGSCEQHVPSPGIAASRSKHSDEPGAGAGCGGDRSGVEGGRGGDGGDDGGEAVMATVERHGPCISGG